MDFPVLIQQFILRFSLVLIALIRSQLLISLEHFLYSMEQYHLVVIQDLANLLLLSIIYLSDYNQFHFQHDYFLLCDQSLILAHHDD